MNTFDPAAFGRRSAEEDAVLRGTEFGFEPRPGPNCGAIGEPFNGLEELISDLIEGRADILDARFGKFRKVQSAAMTKTVDVLPL